MNSGKGIIIKIVVERRDTWRFSFLRQIEWKSIKYFASRSFGPVVHLKPKNQ